MSFRLVPKSVTLNDLKQRNSPYVALFHRIRQLSGAHYVKVVEHTPILSAADMQLKECSFQRYSQLSARKKNIQLARYNSQLWLGGLDSRALGDSIGARWSGGCGRGPPFHQAVTGYGSPLQESSEILYAERRHCQQFLSDLLPTLLLNTNASPCQQIPPSILYHSGKIVGNNVPQLIVYFSSYVREAVSLYMNSQLSLYVSWYKESLICRVYTVNCMFSDLLLNLLCISLTL